MAESSNSNSKLMGVLAYLGILVLIPIFAAKDDKFARYHANQGATVCVLGIAGYIVNWVVSFILGMVNIGILSMVWSLVYWAFGICLFILMVIGIVNVCKGVEKELPVVGKFNLNLADKLAK